MKTYRDFPEVRNFMSPPAATLSSLVPTGLLTCMLLVLAGCGGDGSATPPPLNVVTRTDLTVRVSDVTNTPIGGALVTATVDGVGHEATTDANGSVEFLDIPVGHVDVLASAAGFDSGESGFALSPFSARQSFGITLYATDAWAVGRAIVLGTHMDELASDGSAITFSVDLAVIGENGAAIETLTSADFSLSDFDCGWGGPRDCASDAEGNDTGYFSQEGEAQFFGLQPSSARHPYAVGVLAERSEAVLDWNERGPALKSFFAALGGNDTASLASVQTEGGFETLTVLGPFTSDGRTYLDAIDQLAEPAGDPPAVLGSLEDSIRLAAAETAGMTPEAERTVLVLSEAGLTPSEIATVSALAQNLGVRVSTIGGNYGLPELAMRTGGFASHVDDPRQFRIVFAVMDQLLAGTTPYYRLQFRIKGDTGTFVSGGNAKVHFRIHVPTSIPNNGVYERADVAIL